MNRFLVGFCLALLALAVAAAWVWHRQPEWLPDGLRQQNPNSVRYAPAVYRWKDAQGHTQVSDTPPKDRPYETVRIDPDTNVVPHVGPSERDARRRE
ncbi:MAG: DUF4124 domain-containing protein [Lysobacteraceae bacterium]